jgi:hypothetical protein
MRRVLVLVLLTFAVAPVLSGAAVAAAPGPGLLHGDYSSHFVVRPATLVFGNGGFFITGPNVSQRDLRARRDGHIRWTTWTSTKAHGVGKAWVNNCNPDCASSTSYSSGPASITASVTRSGHFTHLLIVYRLNSKRHTLRDVLKRFPHGGYYWG